MNGGLDRVRTRSASTRRLVTADYEGKRALFSPTDARPAAGSVTVDCSTCRARSTLTMVQAARALVPSAHLPVLRRYASWMRCPTCRRRTWCRLRLTW
jgi:uncharacterized protein with PIN domain